jgi:hypothetical protein
MVRKVEILAKLGVLAAVALLAPAQAHAQVSFRGAGYFGGGSSLGGGYSFERFSIFAWGNPWFSQGYGWPSGYGIPYGSSYGVPYGYGYGFELSPIPYPYLTTASYPFFTYVTSDQNSPAPKTIEPGKYIRPPVESRPSDDSRSGLVPSAEPSGTRDTRQPIVYRADVPRHADVKQTQTRTSRLVVTRSTAP